MEHKADLVPQGPFSKIKKGVLPHLRCYEVPPTKDNLNPPFVKCLQVPPTVEDFSAPRAYRNVGGKVFHIRHAPDKEPGVHKHSRYFVQAGLQLPIGEMFEDF